MCAFVTLNKRFLTYLLYLRTQTYTEPVPLKCGKVATEYPWICGYFYSVRTHLGSGKGARSVVELDPADALVTSDVDHIPAT